MGPASNPNLSFSTNFAEILYYFEKWCHAAIPI
jgi:hypothetical protein